MPWCSATATANGRDMGRSSKQDIALSNIALDLIGQARNLYQYAARLIGEGPATEDTLAYHRDGWDFKNSLLVEQTNGDWGKTVLRQFFFSAYQYFFYRQLLQSQDSELAAHRRKIAQGSDLSPPLEQRMGDSPGRRYSRKPFAYGNSHGPSLEIYQ